MMRTKIQTYNTQSTIRVVVHCTALFHNVFYQCMKFQVDSFCSLEIMASRKIQKEKLVISEIKGR